MDTHINLCAGLHIVLGILGVMMGIIFILGVLGVSLIIGLNASPADASTAIPIVGIAGFFISGIMMFTPLLGLAAGIGIYKRDFWGRVLGIIVAVLYLPAFFPFGILLSVYTLWVLLSSETSLFFQRPMSA